MTKLTRFSLLPCLAVVTLVVSACGSNNANETSSTATEQQQVRQVIIDKNQAFLDGDFKQFCAAYTTRYRSLEIGDGSKGTIADCVAFNSSWKKAINKNSNKMADEIDSYSKWENANLDALPVAISGDKATVSVPKPPQGQYELIASDKGVVYTLIKSGDGWLISQRGN